MAFLQLRIRIVCLLIAGFSCAKAQMDSAALSQEYYNQGVEVFGFAHRKQAAELFIMSTQMNPKNAKAQLMAGQSIMLSVQKEKSLEYFRRAWKLDPQVDPEILYFLGQAYHYSEKFDSAILFYDWYNRVLARSLNFEKSIKINEVNRKIFECRNAVIYIANPVKVTIQNLDERINSEYPDYAPTISEDESLMVFTSRRPGDNMNERVAVDHEYYEEVFISEKVNGEWQPAKNPGTPLNTGYHNASVNLSPDGKEVIIYHDTGGGDLLLANRKADGTWSTPRPLDGINTEYLESSATITEDGKMIYFTSNRPGGYGGTDVYSCELGRNGRWVNVKNLGPMVNTELDEEGVFISASGLHLYYSSNGLAGMGDLDVYRSTFDKTKGEWGEPVNLGYPINSVENDIYFVLTADEKHAYISSLRRENLGEQDIYRVDMQEWQPVLLDRPEFSEAFAHAPAAAENVSVVAAPVVTTPAIQAVAAPATPAPDNQAIKSAPASVVVDTKPVAEEVKPPVEVKSELKVIRSQVNLVWHIVDDATGNPLDAEVKFQGAKGEFVDVKKSVTGSYAASVIHDALANDRYKVDVSVPEYIPYVASLYFEGATAPTRDISENIRLKRVPVSTHVVNVGYVLNVYFSHDEVEPLSFEGIRNLLQMIKHSPTLRVEIGGHTDSLGPDEYNVGLSKRRAEGVRNLLIKGGADPKRVTAVGYGESRPVDTNDTMEGRRLNRRIEFIILEP